jgi:PiT family inorganic phosphate transporter
VSTTHALTGAIVGTALVMGGTGAVQWPLLAATVLAPLALSPVLSGIIAYALHAASASRLSAASQYCVCLEQQSIGIASVDKIGGAAVAAAPASRVLVGDSAECAGSSVVSRLRLTDAMHWGSSAVLSFARGMNDNPKIVALGIAAAGSGIFVAGAVAMGLGSYLYGRRVTKTLAEKVAKIDRSEGLAASIVASALVLLASFFALPVSTTHVATGAIVGGGLRSGSNSIHWNMVGTVGFAWLITLPAAALAAAAAWSVLGIS